MKNEEKRNEIVKRIPPSNKTEDEKVSLIATHLYNREDIETNVIYKSVMIERVPHELLNANDRKTYSNMSVVRYGVFRDRISGRFPGKPRTPDYNSYGELSPRNFYIATAKSTSNNDINSLLFISELDDVGYAFCIFEISKNDKTGNFFDKMVKFRHVDSRDAIPVIDFMSDDYTVSKYSFLKMSPIDSPILESVTKYEDKDGLAFRLTGGLVKTAMVVLGLRLKVIRKESYGKYAKIDSERFGDDFCLFETVINDLITKRKSGFSTEYFVLDALNSIFDEISD